MDAHSFSQGEPASGVKNILIVGGGSAGWLCAAYLAKTLGTQRTGGPSITLLESPEIGTIGVGEGTFPSIRGFLRHLDIDEAEFMRETHATFKQGIRFDDWLHAPGHGHDNHYLHPFDLPYLDAGELPLLPYWLAKPPADRPAFAQAVSVQKRLADAHLAPKRANQGNYGGPLNYAYHFDAGKFANFLARYAKLRGVNHLSGTMTHCDQDETGAVTCVHSPEQGTISADLFIDCTGFRSELIGKTFKVPFQPIDDILFTDRALACQIPYADPAEPLASYTISTAHEGGWIWDIGLPERRGIGCVYSSRHISDDEAHEAFLKYVGARPHGAKEIIPRKLAFEAGYRKTHWVKNCVAVGLSGGFLEPLEATGLMFIQTAVIKIAEFFPRFGPPDASAAQFNAQMLARYQTTIDFIKLHYCLSQRSEPFWRDNCAPESLSDALRQKLAIWAHRPPSRFDFIEDNESFAYTSYQYILYGMQFRSGIDPALLRRKDEAERLFALLEAQSEREAKGLPSHRQLINTVYREGFSGVRPMPHIASFSSP
jgi:tryptophan 7-halogenase